MARILIKIPRPMAIFEYVHEAETNCFVLSFEIQPYCAMCISPSSLCSHPFRLHSLCSNRKKTANERFTEIGDANGIIKPLCRMGPQYTVCGHMTGGKHCNWAIFSGATMTTPRCTLHDVHQTAVMPY